jgi:hypothetical protein
MHCLPVVVASFLLPYALLSSWNGHVKGSNEWKCLAGARRQNHKSDPVKIIFRTIASKRMRCLLLYPHVTTS